MAARSTKRSGLGRGLDALLPVDRPEEGFAAIPVDRIAPNPHQPRRRFDEGELQTLADSIAAVGVLQPIVVRTSDDDGSYVLVAGERRLRAAAIAGLEQIPAVIRSPDADEANLSEALIENLQRTDLGPLEEAAAYRELMEDFSMSHDEIGARVGKSRSAVTNTVRLLQLPPAIQAMVESGALAAGAARALLGVEDESYAVHIAERAVAEGWSVRRVEQAVKDRQASPTTAAARLPAVRPAAVIELEERLAEHLDAKVSIVSTGRGGRLVVKFRSVDDLERIYRQFLS